MYALIVSGNPELSSRYVEALRGEGFEVARVSDIGLLTEEPAKAAGGSVAPDLILLNGAPVPVLLTAIEAVRGDSVVGTAKLLVVDPGVGLNDRSRILRAGADLCQAVLSPKDLPGRVRELVKKVEEPEESPATEGGARALGSMAFDPDRGTVSVSGVALRPTRMQYDVLSIIARHGGRAVPARELVAELVSRGHELDLERLSACVEAVNRELVRSGCAVEEDPPGSYTIEQAGVDERLSAVALIFLQALSTALSNISLYGEGHTAVTGFIDGAHSTMRQILECTGSDRVTLERDGGRILVNGKPHDPAMSTPEPIVEYMRRFGVQEMSFDKSASKEDLLILCRTTQWGGDGTPAEALGRRLAELGAKSITVRRSRKYEAAESKSLILTFARQAVRNAVAASQLFAEDGVLEFHSRGREQIFRGHEEIREFLAATFTGFSIQVTTHKDSGRRYTSSCVISGPGTAAVKDTCFFEIANGKFTKLRIESRLRLG